MVRGTDVADVTVSGSVLGGGIVYGGSQLLTGHAMGRKTGAVTTGEFIRGIAGGVWVEWLGIPVAAPIAKDARAATYLVGEKYKLENNKMR